MCAKYPTRIISIQNIFWFKRLVLKNVGNKTKGRISKRGFQENKARHIFQKTNISYPLMRTRMCAYQRVRNVCFSENLTCSVSLKHPFWDSPFFSIVIKGRVIGYSWRYYLRFYLEIFIANESICWDRFFPILRDIKDGNEICKIVSSEWEWIKGNCAKKLKTGWYAFTLKVQYTKKVKTLFHLLH